jgi:hypothetical protein
MQGVNLMMGGVLEVGAGALLAETVVGAALLGASGADDFGTGFKMVRDNEYHQTLKSQGVSGLTGASPETADKVVAVGSLALGGTTAVTGVVRLSRAAPVAIATEEAVAASSQLAKPGEDLFVGTYSQSRRANVATGLNRTHTPHHVVQDAVSGTTTGRGITINIAKEIHRLTETYGKMRNFTSLRQHLAADIRDLRALLRDFGYNRSVVNRQLQDLDRQNKALGGFAK